MWSLILLLSLAGPCFFEWNASFLNWYFLTAAVDNIMGFVRCEGCLCCTRLIWISSFLVTVYQTSIFPASERRARFLCLVPDGEASLLNICNKLTDVKTKT